MRATSFDEVGERSHARRVFLSPVLPAFLRSSSSVSLRKSLSRKASPERLAVHFFRLFLVPLNAPGAALAPVSIAFSARRRR